MRPSLGLLADVGLGPERLVDIAREAEAAGFESVRMIEHEYDSFAFAQAIASGTNHIITGSVARHYTRHPLLTAQTAAVIDQLTPGRFVIGLGSGPPKRSDPGTPREHWGMPTDQEVARLDEYIEVVRRALTEDEVDFRGEFYKFTDVRMAVRPVSPHIPIWLAAAGKRTAKLAGRVADGMLVQLAGTEMIDRVLDSADEAARNAGRDPDALPLGNLIMTCVSNDAAEARRAMRAHLVDWYLHQPRIQQQFAEGGYEDMANEIKRCNPPHDTRGSVDEILVNPQAQAAAEAISDEALDEFTIAGTPGECRSRIEQFLDWGVDVPILCPYPVGTDWSDAYREVIQAFADTPAYA